MTRATRRQVLEETGLLHPRAEAVTAPLFNRREPFFLALDCRFQWKPSRRSEVMASGVLI
jgi:hypothetical protein